MNSKLTHVLDSAMLSSPSMESLPAAITLLLFVREKSDELDEAEDRVKNEDTPLMVEDCPNRML